MAGKESVEVGCKATDAHDGVHSMDVNKISAAVPSQARVGGAEAIDKARTSTTLAELSR